MSLLYIMNSCRYMDPIVCLSCHLLEFRCGHVGIQYVHHNNIELQLMKDGAHLV